MTFKIAEPVILTIVEGKKSREVSGIFEGYGPMADECSILIPREDNPQRNRRLWAVKVSHVRQAPPTPAAPQGVPQA